MEDGPHASIRNKLRICSEHAHGDHFLYTEVIREDVDRWNELSVVIREIENKKDGARV